MKGIVYAVCVGAVLATPANAAVKHAPDYRELIFCARFAAGLHAVLKSVGEEDTSIARGAFAAFQAFGMRAAEAVPFNKRAEVGDLVKASDDAVRRIILSGDANMLNGISKTCAGL